jgi:PKD repeat protein
VPSFTYAPSAPLAKSDVTFDGSLSTDSDGRIVSYAWNFGDGSQGSDPVVKHEFAQAGSYTVTLTVTDDRSQSASTSKSVSVVLTPAPKAEFAVSPSAPAVNEKVFFNAAASTASIGRTIVRYDWDYGQGRQDTGQLVWHIYSQPGEYTVVLTVTDDAGNTGTATKTVKVGSGGLTPSFTFSPTSPINGDTVYFNATGSTGTNAISSYAWDFGDGGTSAGATPSHVFACRGGTSSVSFVVRLTIRDTVGNTGTTTTTVAVRNCGT